MENCLGGCFCQNKSRHFVEDTKVSTQQLNGPTTLIILQGHQTKSPHNNPTFPQEKSTNNPRRWENTNISSIQCIIFTMLQNEWHSALQARKLHSKICRNFSLSKKTFNFWKGFSSATFTK